MASRYPEHDIFPKEGMDHRDPAGLEWFANLWRPERAHPVSVRPGFGQLTQQDCTAEKANVDGAVSAQATGGYQRHLGSYLYNTNFGHRQIVSVFESVAQYSGSDAPVIGSTFAPFRTVHGAAKTAVVSIYDITTGAQWEEVLILHTSETCQENDIPQSHAHFETTGGSNSTIPTDFIKYKYHSGDINAAFSQIGDSVVLCLGEYGVWVYHGIDVAKAKQRVLDSSDIAPRLWTGAGFTVGTNYQTKDCEGSVLQPVSGVRGLNGEQFAYFTKSEFPAATAATLCKGRMVYALRGVLYFSDVGQPGAIMADNFAEIQTEGGITGLGEHNGQLFAFSKTEAHLIQMRQNNLAGAAFANQVSVTHVRISKRTGCVGPRSVVETPFGVCWVSDQGCHMAGAQQAVEDISDAIRDYWDAGIVNPTTHFYASSGAGGTKTQPSVIYKHVGEPTLAYEPQSETLYLSYDDHLLVYQFRHKSWSIWPVSTSFDPMRFKVIASDLVSSYLPESQTTTTWTDSADSNNMTGAVTAPPAFDGNDYYTIGNPANLQFGNNFSIEAWASQDPDASQGAERLISRDDVGGGNRCFALSQNDTNGRPYAAIFVGGVYYDANGTNNYADGAWHHYMVTHDGLVLRLYVDGVLEASRATGGPMDNDPVAWEVGRRQDGTDYLEGRCDTVRFYSSTLTATEVLQNYNAGKIAHGGTPSPPQSRQTINCLQVLSDSQGTYIVGGLHDQTEDGLSPAVQSSSYYITQLGRGGSMDRSCKDEDERKHGWGRYQYSEDPSAVLALDLGLFWSLEKPTRIWTTDDGEKVVYEFPIFLTCLRPAVGGSPWTRGAANPAYQFDLSWNASFTFEGLGVPPESSPRSDWTITSTANSFAAARNAFNPNQITEHKVHMLTLRLSAPKSVSARTEFTVVKSQVVDIALPIWDKTLALLWQQQHLYAQADRATKNRLQSSVEWGMKTGQIGMNEGKVLRVRGINAIMEVVSSQSSELYNSYTVSDYKRLSGQYPDYEDYTPGNRRQTQTNLIRERMLYGRRVFNSLAKWAPTTAVNTKYLIDSPELNSIVTSVSSRGEHVSVGLYGYATNKADELTIHRLSLGVLDTGHRRRKGR